MLESVCFSEIWFIKTMSRKAILITIGVLIVGAAAIVVVVAIVTAFVFLAPSGDTVAMSAATSVGEPIGAATTKSIGPAGGSMASPDGRITVNIPPNAVPGAVNFSIQPITNLAQGGSGIAYRLEPNGQKFAAPIKISFKPDGQELEGTIPQAFNVAYQDSTGVWQVFTTTDIDQANKTITVSATHFTDFSLWTFQLSPRKATLRVGETQVITLVGCFREGGPANTIRRWFGAEPLVCMTANASDSSNWKANYGTIVPSGDSKNSTALYTAPAKKPNPNVDTVRFVYRLRFADKGQDIVDVRTSQITIVDRGYRATGKDGSTAYWGVICSLEEPFAVTGINPVISYPFKFVPSSATAGTMSYSARNGNITASGSGSYTIEGAETDHPSIVINTRSTASIPVKTTTGGGKATIKLVPLAPDANDCGN